ncbi:DUF748 domain-containing protein [Candidatus Sumerlaeota bacterium]|nr:DUF748 domain-containing protein [Candidatus Sumerlaeota bacterium]
MRRDILKALVITFLAAVFLLTVASQVLRFALSPARLRAEIVEILHETTGRNAGFAHASVSLMRGVVIKRFYLPEPPPSDRESVTFERAVIGVSLWDLLHGRTEVKSIELISPHIELVIEPDGTTNFTDVLEHMRGEGDEAESPDSGDDSSTGGEDDEGEGDEADDERVFELERLRVRGGSLTLVQRRVEARTDRYIDLTDLAVDIDGLSTARSFPITVSGSLGIERQTTFSFTGEIDPVLRTLEGDLTLPQVQHSLISSLLEIGLIEAWNMDDGDLRDVSLHIETGQDFSPAVFTGDLDLDDIDLRMGISRFALAGEMALSASYEMEDDVLHLSEVEIGVDREGEDGEFRMSGEIFPSRGGAEIDVDLSGIGSRNIRGLLPEAVSVSGGDTWIDARGHLSLASQFQRGRFEGEMTAREFLVALPTLLGDDIRLNGLRVEGDMDYDLASEEFTLHRSLWTLPGVIPESTPVAMRGSSQSALGLSLPEIDLPSVSERLTPRPAPPPSSLRVAQVIQGMSGVQGLPLRLRIPLVRGEAGREWRDVEGTLRIGAVAIGVENWRAQVDGGEVTLRGIVSQGGRSGTISCTDLSFEQVRALWGEIPIPTEITGVVNGVFGGDVDGLSDLSRCALNFSVEEAVIGEHWLLEELADYTGVETIRRWSDAGTDVVAALDGGSWHLIEIALDKPDAGLTLEGLMGPEEALDLVATLSVPPDVASALEDDPLVSGAPRDRRGWRILSIALSGTVSQPLLRPISSGERREIAQRARGGAVVSLFERFDMEAPGNLLRSPQPIEEPEVQLPPQEDLPETPAPLPQLPPMRLPSQEEPEALLPPEVPSAPLQIETPDSIEPEPALPQLPPALPPEQRRNVIVE